MPHTRVDFSNSVLYRVAAVHLHPLQSAINAAARCVLELPKFDPVSISAMSCTSYRSTNGLPLNCV